MVWLDGLLFPLFFLILIPIGIVPWIEKFTPHFAFPIIIPLFIHFEYSLSNSLHTPTVSFEECIFSGII